MVVCEKVEYQGRDDFNLIFAYNIFRCLQVTRATSDSVFFANTFPILMRKGDFVGDAMQFIERPFPEKNVIDQVKKNLQGDWLLVNGFTEQNLSGKYTSLT